MKLLQLLSLAIISLAALSVSGQRCGSQAGGALCANNLCCSEHGYCGSTTDYCGARCQSQCGGSSGRCGRQAGGALCQNGACCSEHGYCGTTIEYCGARCQSRCGGSSPPTSSSDIGRLISSSLFDQMLKYRNDPRCNANGFYQYSAFITAARSFPGFGTTGTDDTRKREIAAFFGQTSHETTGGWATAPDGAYAWGYCHSREVARGTYCSSTEYPCPAGREYYGRGPIQLTHNYNYARAGSAIGSDLINNPDLVATDPVITFKTAIWFWMTPQGNKPSTMSLLDHGHHLQLTQLQDEFLGMV